MAKKKPPTPPKEHKERTKQITVILPISAAEELERAALQELRSLSNKAAVILVEWAQFTAEERNSKK